MSRLLKLAGLLLLLLGSSSTLVRGQAGQDKPPSRYSSALVLPALSVTTLARLEVGGELYRDSSANFSDLRLRDGKGRLTAFVIQQERGQRERRKKAFQAIREPELRLLDTGGLEISFTIKPDTSLEQINSILLHSPLREFERRAILEWDQGTGNWVPLVKDSLLFDYSSILDVRNLEIRLPTPIRIQQDSRFRLIVDKVTQLQEDQVMELTRRLRGQDEVYREERVLVNRQPFRIDRLEFGYEQVRVETETPLETDYPVRLLEQRTDQTTQSTELLIESGREPLVELRLSSSDDNFSRPVEIAVEVEGPPPPEGAPRYSKVGSGVLTKIHVPGSELEQMELRFPEQRARRYRLRIANQDSPPLQISGVSARGSKYQLFFLAQPGESYSLEHGGPPQKSPSLDTAALKAALRNPLAPVPAALGSAVPLPAARPESEPFRGLPTWVFWLVALGLVALLASGLYRAVQRVDEVK